MGAEHEVERTRFGQVFTAAIRTLLNAVFIRQLIGPESGFAGATVYHRITERVFMATGLERGAVSEDRAVEADATSSRSRTITRHQ